MFMVANRVNVAVVATVVADNVTGIKCVFFFMFEEFVDVVEYF